MIKFQGSLVDDHNLSKKVYFTFFTFSLIWLLLIFLAPLFASLGGMFEKISSYIYIFFSKVCHQNEDRSFHLFEHMLGVCSRCVWIYVGIFIGTSFYPLKYRLNNTNLPSLVYLFVAAIILLLDVMLDAIGILPNTFFSRSATGFLIGFVLPFYIIPGYVKFFDEVHSFVRSKLSYRE